MPQGQYSSAMIVLLSDGENTTSPDPYEAAQAAAQRGVRVNTVGVGSLEGISLPIEGFLVHTRLDETMLQDIAQITDGQYFLAESEEALAEVYDNLSTQLIIRPEKMEITSLLAGAGIVLLLLGVSLSLAWFGRMP
jgi:Ca-activated chloride channel family protein